MPRINKKITPEIIQRIYDIDFSVIPYKEKGKFYKDLANELGVSKFTIRAISSKTSIYGIKYRSKILKRLDMELVKKIIESIYLEYFQKTDELNISAINRYEILQIFIKPEKIIMQIDERLMTNVTDLSSALHRNFAEYKLRLNKKII